MPDVNEPVQTHVSQPWGVLYLLPGEVVEVRSTLEIEATLDTEGKLMGLPFTEEMRQFCGRKFSVFRRVDKGSVDTVGIRRFQDIVMLSGAYCNGAFHGGCDRMCRLFWHEAWLRRSIGIDCFEPLQLPVPHEAGSNARRTASDGDRLRCQSTELIGASETLSWAAPCQYMLDSLNYPLSKLLNLAWIMISNKTRRRLGLPGQGRLTGCKKVTPDVQLSLRSGDHVRIKSPEGIAATLDTAGRNRGLEFMPEMTQFCGQTFRVYKRAERLIHEKTGRVHELKNTVILENCTCNGMSHRGCPRDCFFLVREVWLDRI